MTFRVATWNVNSLRVRLPHLHDWLAAHPLDVAGLQETKLPDADFPGGRARRRSAGTRSSAGNAPTTASRSLRASRLRLVAGIPGFDDEQRRVLAGTVQGVRIINVYVPNGQTSARTNSPTSCAGLLHCAITCGRTRRA